MPRLAEPPARRNARPSAARAELSVPALTNGRALLRGVTWGQYVALRAETDHTHLKLTYDGPAGGLLEFEMPQGAHDSVSRLLCLLVAAFAEERRIDLLPIGSLTQNRADVARGAEGDESFYVASRPANPDHVDLDAGDPPPDLVVEVDVTSPSVSKLPIYAAFGVPEVWVWREDGITVRRLDEDGEYRRVGESTVLPGFSVALAADIAGRRTSAPQYELLAEFRAAVRDAATR